MSTDRISSKTTQATTSVAPVKSASTPPTAAAIAPPTAPAPPPKLPSLNDSARYREAAAKVVRLQHEVGRLERIATDLQERRNEHVASRDARLRAIVDGATAASVRVDPVDTKHAEVRRDLHVTRQALEVAERELVQVAGQVKDEVAAPLAPYFRPKARAAVVAWLAYARAMAELDALSEDLAAVELLGYGGCDRRDLPYFRGGNPAHESAHSALIIRDLITAGLIDEAADAERLRGLAIAPKPAPWVPAEPKPEKPRQPFSIKKFLQQLGAAD